VVDCILADNSKLGVSDPSPVNDLFLADKSCDLRSFIEVVELKTDSCQFLNKFTYLNDSSLSSFISTHNDHVALAMHNLSFNGHSFTLNLEVLAGVDHDNVLDTEKRIRIRLGSTYITILDGDIFLRLKRQNLVLEKSRVEVET
jgi:hypothetical protein